MKKALVTLVLALVATATMAQERHRAFGVLGYADATTDVAFTEGRTATSARIETGLQAGLEYRFALNEIMDLGVGLMNTWGKLDGYRDTSWKTNSFGWHRYGPRRTTFDENFDAFTLSVKPVFNYRQFFVAPSLNWTTFGGTDALEDQTGLGLEVGYATDFSNWGTMFLSVNWLDLPLQPADSPPPLVTGGLDPLALRLGIGGRF